MARILVTDDAGFMRTMLRDTLTGAGHEVVGEASNGRDAVRLYGELNPDLITLDVTMPEMDGREALGAILAAHPGAKAVMCSAVGQESTIKECLLAGARDYLVKPFESSQVIATVQRALITKETNPATLLQEIVAWFDLGEIVVRQGLLSYSAMQEIRDSVAARKDRNLGQELVDRGVASEEDVESFLAMGHRDVSMAYFLLKQKIISVEQLRCALVLMRKSGRLLGFTLSEHGFCTQQQIAELVKKIPPFKSQNQTLRI